ncbi:ATPase-like protein [Salinisphaera hydrothermalis C27AD]
MRVGADSNGLVDLDLDWPEARALAPLVLPEARCAFGRKSAPKSHRLVICPEAEEQKLFSLPAQCKSDTRFSTGEGHDLCTLEIRGAASGANRYTVFPPSTHEGTGERIEWATDDEPKGIGYEYLRSRAGVLAFLSVAARCWPGEGSRDECAMAVCGALLRAGHGADDVDEWVVAVARQAGDDEADDRAKARATAKKLETDRAATGLPKAVELLDLPDTCLKTFRQWLGADDAQPLATLEQMDIGWMLESEPPARRWLLQDLLPLNVVGLLAAGGGTGKSMLTIQLAVAVATGRPFLGIPVGEPGPVLMVAAEDDAEEMRRRLWRVVTQLREDGDLTPEDEREARHNLKVLPRVAENNRLTYVADGAVRGTGRAQAIAVTVNQLSEPKLVVLDPVSRFRGGEENNNEHATRFIEEAEKLREATGATVLMVHHVSKAGLAAGAEGIAAEGVRGASALLDGARWAMAMGTLRKDEAGKFGIDRDDAGKYVRLEAVKNNYAAPWPGLWLQRLSGGVMAATDLRAKDAGEAKAERHGQVLSNVLALLEEKQGRGEKITRTGLRAYASKEGRLGAGDQLVRAVVQEAIDDGAIALEEGFLVPALGF